MSIKIKRIYGKSIEKTIVIDKNNFEKSLNDNWFNAAQPAGKEKQWEDSKKC